MMWLGLATADEDSRKFFFSIQYWFCQIVFAIASMVKNANYFKLFGIIFV